MSTNDEFESLIRNFKLDDMEPPPGSGAAGRTGDRSASVRTAGALLRAAAAADADRPSAAEGSAPVPTGGGGASISAGDRSAVSDAAAVPCTADESPTDAGSPEGVSGAD